MARGRKSEERAAKGKVLVGKYPSCGAFAGLGAAREMMPARVWLVRLTEELQRWQLSSNPFSEEHPTLNRSVMGLILSS